MAFQELLKVHSVKHVEQKAFDGGVSHRGFPGCVDCRSSWAGALGAECFSHALNIPNTSQNAEDTFYIERSYLLPRVKTLQEHEKAARGTETPFENARISVLPTNPFSPPRDHVERSRLYSVVSMQ